MHYQPSDNDNDSGLTLNAPWNLGIGTVLLNAHVLENGAKNSIFSIRRTID